MADQPLIVTLRYNLYNKPYVTIHPQAAEPIQASISQITSRIPDLEASLQVSLAAWQSSGQPASRRLSTLLRSNHNLFDSDVNIIKNGGDCFSHVGCYISAHNGRSEVLTGKLGINLAAHFP